METTHENKKIAIASIVGFVVGFAVCWVTIDTKSNQIINTDTDIMMEDKTIIIDDTFNSNEANAVPDELNMGSESEFVSNETALPIVSENVISISDQPAGNVVSVDILALTERSWAVVYEDMRGRPGSILGAHRYVPGLHNDVAVELQRDSEVGNVYYGMIHHDDGDDIFDHNIDVPLTDETGGPLMVRFMTTSSESE